MSSLLPRIAGLAIVLCVLVGLVRFAGQSLRFRRRVRRCGVVEAGPARESLDALLQKLRIKKTVTLVADADGNMPAAFGLWRWRILLPSHIDEKLTRDELDALLAHELAHLVRGDAWWLLFGRLLCSLGLFQPLNFLARREWQRAAEWQCDEWALERQVDPLALARCLTRVAEWSLRQARFAPAMGAVGSRSQLGERVERLIEQPTARDPWKRGPRRWLSLAAVLAAIALVTCFGPRATFSATKNEGGERSTEDGEGEAMAATGATGGLSASAIDPYVLKEQHALEQGLQSLDDEIRSLDESLRAVGATAEMTNILDRLCARADAIRTRREILHDLVSLDPNSTAPQLPLEEK